MRFPDDVPILSTGDVTLRAHQAGDAPACVEQCLDPVSIRWTTVPLGYTLDNAHQFLGTLVPGGWERGSEYAFAIEATHPDGQRRFSGTVSLRDEGSRRAEIAFGAHPAVRGHGVMSTAVRVILDWGFDTLGLETVSWWANRGNVGSRRVAWRAGFSFGGTVKRWLDHRGEYPDAWVGTLHRDDERSPTTPWWESPVLRGERVLLRPLDEGDVDRIVEGCRDERTRHFLPFLPTPYDAVDAREFLVLSAESASVGAVANWAMADPVTGRHLGSVGVHNRTHMGGLRQGEIGYWTHPDARGRGLTSEAVGLVIQHAFADEADGGLGMERLSLRAAATNLASQHVARANGMLEVGRQRRSETLGDGSVTDMVEFDLPRADWLAGRR